ncbi:hypothetical protein [Phyllobacterium bourgognense]|uniref:Uncharacterized protein n=1 Tax=Phyllobacterium bourgognense TaxID=314236 RepID=A0A368YNP7_9HYPH|nr:hypothetical protein [Phyllobacterium bourgognense]RCW81850.1 hypothetical protein C7476_10932 [Phyllobacterium bourgognense]
MSKQCRPAHAGRPLARASEDRYGLCVGAAHRGLRRNARFTAFPSGYHGFRTVQTLSAQGVAETTRIRQWPCSAGFCQRFVLQAPPLLFAVFTAAAFEQVTLAPMSAYGEGYGSPEARISTLLAVFVAGNIALQIPTRHVG